jgi:hypothetical protein
MIIHCVSFGSLWWLRPGQQVDDPMRFTSHAALFNTTGFISGSRERRSWHVPGIVRINAGMHRHAARSGDYVARSYESRGIERRGEWKRLLLGRQVNGPSKVDVLLLCVKSETIGRIDFGLEWSTNGVDAVAASACKGMQETLIVAPISAKIRTSCGEWEVTWNGFRRKK